MLQVNISFVIKSVIKRNDYCTKNSLLIVGKCKFRKRNEQKLQLQITDCVFIGEKVGKRAKIEVLT